MPWLCRTATFDAICLAGSDSFLPAERIHSLYQTSSTSIEGVPHGDPIAHYRR